MAPRLRLEVFDNADAAAGETIVMQGDAFEDARLAAFESGYKAGWDDALIANADDRAALQAEVARNLQTLAFTYHEARAHVLSAVAPVICDALAKVLPEAARASLPRLVADLLRPAVEAAADAPLSLRIHPAQRDAVESLLAGQTSLPLAITPEPMMGEGQAWLKLGEAELRVDLDAAVADIRRLLAEFFALSEKEPRDG
ncbi:flagellar biosynthesis protein [Ruixingdingia sedimenti]|uniref:Flagellar biosynthesis protein n=1 Tax=Ruixingdingia sedimenti TaxID=3073604 RepID=A0ABU1F778_9RHOB|nr:flagellar biosynthesis protein [Xinfangfangia sp. LG-4]MDR5652726.1 flagellar biosynthesis protein [Xinfangfangia sp. LG-4]